MNDRTRIPDPPRTRSRRAAIPTRPFRPRLYARPRRAGIATATGSTSTSSRAEPRSWVQRLVIRGRRRDFGLGSVSLVSLAEAREKARENRKLAREGGDPLAERRRARSVPSFAEVTARVLEQKQAGWRSEKHRRGWIRTLEQYAFPRIGKMPVSEVTGADVLDILTPIWHTKAPTARSVHERIRAVLEWAVAMELRSDNPL